MSEHPIEGLMKTAMSSIESLVDVNTIVGDAITTESGIVIIPISKVCFGFAAGGSEFSGETMTGYKKIEKEETVEYKLPFGGGSGGTVSIHPVAFVTISGDTVKINPIEHASVLDKLIDYIPDFMERLNIDADKVLKKCGLNKLNSNNNKEFDFELSKKNGIKECRCKKENDKDGEIENFEPEKSKVKNVMSLESTKGPIKKKKVKIEYEDDNNENNENNEDYIENFGINEDDNIEDD